MKWKLIDFIVWLIPTSYARGVLKGLAAKMDSIASIWHVDDVLSVRPDLTRAQAYNVLVRVEDDHDASVGINWDTIEWDATSLYGPPPEWATELTDDE